MLVVGVQLKRHNFGQWGSFRGLVDIPMMCLFVRELWWETHGLDAMSPPKTPISAIGAVYPLQRLRTTAQHDVFFVLALRGSTSLARGQHVLFEPI